MNRTSTSTKTLATCVLFSFLLEFILPVTVFSLTSGPSQPEFGDFEPVATNGMVNEFSGQFTYNLPVVDIPGPNGSGYAMSLSYHSGLSPEEDASWVGYGWSLNPGAINRSKRGFPDDYHKEKVTYYNKTKKNETFSIGYYLSAQAFSGDLTFGLNSMLRFNNHTGYSVVQGFSVDAFGIASLAYNIDDGYGKFSASINWTGILNKATGIDKKLAKELEGIGFSEASASKAVSRTGSNINNAIDKYGIYLMTSPPNPTNTLKSYSKSYNVRFGLTGSVVPFIPAEIGPTAGITGNYTWQKGIDKETIDTYGYMYSGAAEGDDDAMMDYFTEKEAPYTKRDRFLGIPFSNADIFSLSGEGLGGGFRLFNRRVGTFRPNAKESDTKLFNIGLELGVGFANGFGADASAGNQDVIVKEWKGVQSNQYRFASHDDVGSGEYDGEPYYFRFTNDMGGKVAFAQSDEPYRADITSLKLPSLNTDSIEYYMNERSGRSSYIAYTTNEDMLSTIASIHYKSYTKDPKLLSGLVKRDDPAIAKGVGEIATFNTNGLRYVYGLPVYARNERNLVFTKFRDWDPRDPRRIASYQHESDDTYVNGEVRKAPYASMYLLTEITTDDYIDRTYDGPTADDFGGYTKFSYRRSAGSQDKIEAGDAASQHWYKWRSPYTGYHFNPGKLADGRDDFASVASGEKELYYLFASETKTHAAYFITNKTDTVIQINGKSLHLKGSGQERMDAYEAYRGDPSEETNERISGQPWDKLLTGYDGQWKTEFQGKFFGGRHHGQKFITQSDVENVTPNKSEYLERIEVYAKDTDGFPATQTKRVHFEYDYELMWADYGYWTRIDTIRGLFGQPIDYKYDTIYAHPTSLNSAVGLTNDIPASHKAERVGSYRYGKLTLKRVWSEYEGTFSAKISPYEFEYTYRHSDSLDASVPAQYSSIIKANNGLSELDQNPRYTYHDIDRWGNYRKWGDLRTYRHQAHVDQTPAGGFDPAAWHLKVVRLPSGGEIQVQYEQHDYSYVQDRPAMAYVRLHGQQHLSGNKYRYFLDVENDLNYTQMNKKKRLQRLMDDVFRTGGEKIFFRYLYKFKECGAAVDIESFPGGLNDYVSGYSDVKEVGIDGATGRLYVDLDGDYSPNSLASEFAKVNKIGKLNCNSPNEDLDDVNAFSQEFWLELLKFLPGAALVYQGLDALFGSSAEPYRKHSYLRIPLRSKKGGGVRVKRVLMYDKGLEAGDAVLYGSEYRYEMADKDGTIISSGVATNEPAGARGENSLVRALVHRDEKSWEDKLIAGKDLDQFEGPLGESLLPAPSVGYARVVVKNIHEGQTGSGFVVSEFHTARDFPMQVRHTSIRQEQQTPNPILEILSSVSVSNYWLTQGYSFIVNTMHGQVKRIASYGGQYNDAESWYLAEAVDYDYFKPGESIPMFNGVGESVSFEQPGKEMEVVVESRQVLDTYDNHEVTFDAGFTIPGAVFFPLPFGTLAYRYSGSERKLHSHVTAKLISYPVVRKGLRTYKDGVVHREQYLAFNPENGAPLMIASSDGYDGLDLEQSGDHTGSYVSYTLPATLYYPELGQKASNDGYYAGNVSYDAITHEVSSLGSTAKFSVGDLVELSQGIVSPPSTVYGVFHVTAVGGSTLSLQPLSFSPAMLTGTVGLRVQRSGRRNLLALNAGSLMRYGVSPADALLQTSEAALETKVVAAGATVLSDVWPYDETQFGTVPNGVNNATDYEKGARGKWRSRQSYRFTGDITHAVGGSNRTYDAAGVISNFDLFNWASPTSSDPAWIWSDSATMRSPQGEVIEQVNVIGIPSAARFSHNSSVPGIVAQNAEYGSIFFDSFEDGNGNVGTVAHSGDNARSQAFGWYQAGELEASPRLQASGALVELWLKSDETTPCRVRLGSLQKVPTLVAQSGEWKLYRAEYAPMVLPASGTLGISVRAFGSTYFDDLRAQPLDAQAVCYVYEQSNLRLSALFDDQHFGLFYQYNGEGRLVRKIKETVRGMKTIQERQYHVPQICLTESGGSSPYDVPGGTAAALVQPPPVPTPALRDAVRADGNQFDLLDINLGGDEKPGVKVLGGELAVPSGADSAAAGKQSARDQKTGSDK